MAVSLAVALWLRQHEAADEQGLESTLAQKQRLFSPLCFDPAVIDQVRFVDRGVAVELRLRTAGVTPSSASLRTVSLR